MKPLACSLFAAALAMQGQTRQVVLVRSTSGPFTVTAATSNATQAALTYTPPSGSTCGMEVSESPSYLPLVHDVNPAKFASASSDARAGNTANGGSRTFVVGKRVAEVGIDGVRYSRALQVYTQHYYRLLCSGTTAVTGTFTTLNIPFGATYAETPAGDRNVPGALAQPHINAQARTESVIDPQTGLLLKRLNIGHDNFSAVPGVTFNVIRGNMASVTSANPLFMGVSTNGGGYFGRISADANPYVSAAGRAGWEYYAAHLLTSVNKGGTAPTNPNDAKIAPCLTVNGVTCFSPANVAYERTLTTTDTDTGIGTMTTGDLWQVPGAATPAIFQHGSRAGNVTCDGSNTINLAGGDAFAPFWVNGSGITINSVPYLIASVTHNLRLVLTTTCSVGTFAYEAHNFGVLVSKKTVSADVISVTSGFVNVGMNFYGNGTIRNTFLCSESTVIGPNGNQGNVCRHPSTGYGVYWVDSQTAETHMFRNTNGTGCYSDLPQMFSPSDADLMICAADGISRSQKYYGDHNDIAAGFAPYADLPACNTGGANTPPYLSQQPCTVTTIQTVGTDVGALTAAFTTNPAFAPQFNATRFNAFTFKDQDANGRMLFFAKSAGQFALGWAMIFDPAATTNSEGGLNTGAVGNLGCVGGGNPGCIVAAMPTWNRPGVRWCALKDGSNIGTGWIEGQAYGWAGGNNGPYKVQVVDGAVNGTGNSFSATVFQTCPSNTLGRTGVRCSSITVGSEPFSAGVNPGETGVAGELGAVNVGDRFALSVQFPTSNVPEQMEVILKTAGSVAGTWVYWLYRNVNVPAGSEIYNSSVVLPILYTVCNCAPPGRLYPGLSWEWNWAADNHGMNASGLTLSGQGDHLNGSGHYFWSNGNYVGIVNPSEDARCTGNCYLTRTPGGGTLQQEVFQAQATAAIQNVANFNATGVGMDGSQLQSHPSSGGVLANAARFPYFLDGRPYYGGFASGSPTGNGSNPATIVAGQLYRFPLAALPNLDSPYRKNYSTSAYTGSFPLIDISSAATGDVIGTTSTDSYKYCQAGRANECRAGSTIGDVYVNAPTVTYPYCYQAAQNLNLPNEQDICISGTTSVRDAITQTNIAVSDMVGTQTRVLTKFMRPRVVSPFWTPTVLPNGQWMMFEAAFTGDRSANRAIMLGKIPPPAIADGIDRSKFQPVTVAVPALAGSIAYLRFGYAENGNALYCTSRQESCVSVNPTSTFNATDPFRYETAEAASYTPVACATGCTIVVPAIPNRVLYYQAVYNVSGAVSSGPVTAAVVP